MIHHTNIHMSKHTHTEKQRERERKRKKVLTQPICEFQAYTKRTALSFCKFIQIVSKQYVLTLVWNNRKTERKRNKGSNGEKKQPPPVQILKWDPLLETRLCAFNAYMRIAMHARKPNSVP